VAAKAQGIRSAPRKKIKFAVKSMLRNLTDARRVLDSIPNRGSDWLALDQRWREAASGFLGGGSGAVYDGTDQRVTSLGGIAASSSGIRFRSAGVAFALAGGTAYSHALLADVRALKERGGDAGGGMGLMAVAALVGIGGLLMIKGKVK